MADFVKPIATEINAPTTVGTASTVSDAKVVRAVNTNSSQQAHLVYVCDTDGTTIGTMTLPAFGVCHIPKGKTDKVYAASADVKLTSVTWPRG